MGPIKTIEIAWCGLTDWSRNTHTSIGTSEKQTECTIKYNPIFILEYFRILHAHVCIVSKIERRLWLDRVDHKTPTTIPSGSDIAGGFHFHFEGFKTNVYNFKIVP